MRGARILLVEDDPAICRAIEPALRTEGSSVRRAASGVEALDLLAAETYDLVILDLGLPDMDGTEIISAQRAHSDIPIVVLSARGRESDKVRAFDEGADDFVAKPFSSGELLARLRAALRRRKLERPDTASIRFEGLEIDLERRRALVRGEEIGLSKREHALLVALARAAGGVLTHKEIIRAVWGAEASVDTQFVRVLVAQLRQKLEVDASRPQLISNEPGIGYRIDARPL